MIEEDRSNHLTSAYRTRRGVLRESGCKSMRALLRMLRRSGYRAGWCRRYDSSLGPVDLRGPRSSGYKHPLSDDHSARPLQAKPQVVVRSDIVRRASQCFPIGRHRAVIASPPGARSAPPAGRPTFANKSPGYCGFDRVRRAKQRLSAWHNRAAVALLLRLVLTQFHISPASVSCH